MNDSVVSYIAFCNDAVAAGEDHIRVLICNRADRHFILSVLLLMEVGHKNKGQVFSGLPLRIGLHTFK